jgi:hypothetical protein
LVFNAGRLLKKLEPSPKRWLRYLTSEPIRGILIILYTTSGSDVNPILAIIALRRSTTKEKRATSGSNG